MRWIKIAVLAWLWTALQAVATPALTKYRLEILNLPSTGLYEAVALNDKGWVVGSADVDTFFRRGRAVLWRGGAPEELGMLPGDVYSNALDINNHGQVVGVSGRVGNARDQFPSSEAFTWQNGVMSGLGHLQEDEWPHSSANRISASGVIAGSSLAFGGFAPVLWTNGQVIDMRGTLPTLADTAGVRAINDHDQVVVFDLDGSSSYLYSAEGAYLIPEPDGIQFWVQAINNLGVLAANAYRNSPGDGESFAMLVINGVATELPKQAGAAPHGLGVSALNDANVAVGGYHDISTGTAVSRAGLWADGLALDLNDLVLDLQGHRLTYATDINASGQIIGNAVTAEGRHVPFLLTPVPEVGTLSLMLVGLFAGAIACLRCRSRGGLSG